MGIFTNFANFDCNLAQNVGYLIIRVVIFIDEKYAAISNSGLSTPAHGVTVLGHFSTSIGWSSVCCDLLGDPVTGKGVIQGWL